MKAILGIICALALVLVLQADDKKDVTLKGEVACAKCVLKKSDNCVATVVVKTGDREEIYYFDKESQDKYGKECCSEKRMARITGTAVEKDGKRWITVTKVEYEKKD